MKNRDDNKIRNKTTIRIKWGGNKCKNKNGNRNQDRIINKHKIRNERVQVK